MFYFTEIQCEASSSVDSIISCCLHLFPHHTVTTSSAAQRTFPCDFSCSESIRLGGNFLCSPPSRKLNSKQHMYTQTVSTIGFFFETQLPFFVQNQGTVDSRSTEHNHHKKIGDNRVRKGRGESADVDRAILLALIYCGSRRVNWLRAAVIDVFGQFSSESRFQTTEIYSCSV